MPEGRRRAVPAASRKTTHERSPDRACRAPDDVGRPIEEKTAGGIAGPTLISDVHEVQRSRIQVGTQEPATEGAQTRAPAGVPGLSGKELVEVAHRKRESRADAPFTGPCDQSPSVQGPAPEHQPQIDRPLQRRTEEEIGLVRDVKSRASSRSRRRQRTSSSTASGARSTICS